MLTETLIFILLTLLMGIFALWIPIVGLGGIILGLVNIIGMDTSDQFAMMVWAITLILCMVFTYVGLTKKK